ncbi:MAG: hypothetical protein P4L53_04520 [Candidatus Obscuribacterales bacterium]|nr:hypothetical protein [Candidatus Obscuribacterales bacterium]
MRFREIQIVLLMMLFLQGCSNHSPEKSITAFWSWFSTEYAEVPPPFKPDTEDNESVKISKKLQAINTDLSCKLDAKAETKRALIISARGNKKLFPLVREVVADAPKMKYWKVIAFKPRVEKLEPVEIDGMMVSPEDIFFTAQPHDGVVDISVLLDHTIPPATAEKIAVLMLDQALGEYDAATKIGKTTFAPITELNEDNSNFRELRKAVDDYCK